MKAPSREGVPPPHLPPSSSLNGTFFLSDRGSADGPVCLGLLRHMDKWFISCWAGRKQPNVAFVSPGWITFSFSCGGDAHVQHRSGRRKMNNAFVRQAERVRLAR
jgi:hypothetical protein